MPNILYPADYIFGTKQEDVVLPKIQDFFKRDIKKSEDKFAKSDFFDDDFFYELKSRTITYNKHSTTLITADKIRDDKNLIFLFYFTDGLYYINYDKEKFLNYEKKMFSRANVSWNEKLHYYIPISDLQPISV